MNAEQLEKLLNKEYAKIGKVSIGSVGEEETIPIESLIYSRSVMQAVAPINNKIPILFDGICALFTGYHNVRAAIASGEENIRGYFVGNYRLSRTTSSLFEFIEKVKSIQFLSNQLAICDGKLYSIFGNDGCCVCSDGWASIHVLPKFLNKRLIINKLEKIGSDPRNSDLYDLYINGDRVAVVDTGYGTGYYGGDFDVDLVI